MKLWSENVLVDNSFQPAFLNIEGEIIKEVRPCLKPVKNSRIIEGYIVPGFIDSHIHGCMGYDTMDGTFEALENMSLYLCGHGVTTFFPTTVTDKWDKTQNALSNVASAMKKGVGGARIGGSYAEGPYITAEHRGAHPKELIRDISLEEIKELIESSEGTLKTMIIAPEKPFAEEAVRYLVENGVRVSLGHSSATAEETKKALDAGANTIVHLYNGMASLHHRKPGLLGEALTADCYTELICDGLHVKEIPLQIARICKGADRIILITDCMRAGGMPDGSYSLGELETEVRNGGAYLKEGGNLAGSTLSMDAALKNYMKFTGADLAEAVRTCTENPAKALGIFHEVGSIEAGKRADIVALDENLEVKFVAVGGEIKKDEL